MGVAFEAGESKNSQPLSDRFFFAKIFHYPKLFQLFGLGSFTLAATTQTAVAWECPCHPTRETNFPCSFNSSAICWAGRKSRF
jgi:hypothetical protein